MKKSDKREKNGRNEEEEMGPTKRKETLKNDEPMSTDSGNKLNLIFTWTEKI